MSVKIKISSLRLLKAQLLKIRITIACKFHMQQVIAKVLKNLLLNFSKSKKLKSLYQLKNSSLEQALTKYFGSKISISLEVTKNLKLYLKVARTINLTLKSIGSKRLTDLMGLIN